VCATYALGRSGLSCRVYAARACANVTKPDAKYWYQTKLIIMSDGSDGMQNPDELPSDPGRRKPRTARTPAERLSAVQEKNRRAQKRFRERQKVRPFLK